MALGRKGLTCGAIKGLTVCCFTLCVCVCHTDLYGSAMQSHTKQCARTDREEKCIVYIQFSSPSVILGDHQV
ncbi:unnamed protein product, partial [Staurois parvus]